MLSLYSEEHNKNMSCPELFDDVKQAMNFFPFKWQWDGKEWSEGEIKEPIDYEYDTGHNVEG